MAGECGSQHMDVLSLWSCGVCEDSGRVSRLVERGEDKMTWMRLGRESLKGGMYLRCGVCGGAAWVTVEMFDNPRGIAKGQCPHGKNGVRCSGYEMGVQIATAPRGVLTVWGEGREPN